MVSNCKFVILFRGGSKLFLERYSFNFDHIKLQMTLLLFSIFADIYLIHSIPKLQAQISRDAPVDSP